MTNVKSHIKSKIFLALSFSPNKEACEDSNALGSLSLITFLLQSQRRQRSKEIQSRLLYIAQRGSSGGSRSVSLTLFGAW